ncbi:MAG: SpoIIE family protein phosphatase [Bacteroidales bacterium]
MLDQLNTEVIRSLLQRGEKAINDGMDLSLIAYNKKEGKLEFAGAYNPLIIVRNGEAVTIKADRFPIGMEYSMDRKFTNQEIEVQSGDLLYMFSDGFADQFGGPDCKKFKVGNLKNAFAEIYNRSMDEQKDYLEQLLDWMGDQQQVDDILIIEPGFHRSDACQFNSLFATVAVGGDHLHGLAWCSCHAPQVTVVGPDKPCVRGDP